MSSEDYFLEEADSHIQANLEDSVVKEALKSGVDLREYSTQVEEELKVAENLSIQDYIRESTNIASLHHQIVECDQILENMQKILTSFQADLGSISHEILTLQQESVQMNVKLKNRQAVRGELSQFVDDMVVPEEMIVIIMDSPPHENSFLENLQNLEHKINFLKEQSFRDARSCNDVKDVVDKLKIRGVAKIRDFLLDKINMFKKPMANYHIPQNTILKFKFYYKFLMANNRDVAKEIKDQYVDTMSKVLFSYFKSYSGRLMKLQYDESTTHEDLMGLDDSQVSKSFFMSKPNLKTKASVFSIGQRGEVLASDLEAPILVPHALEKTSTRCPYEKLFRSEQYGLMENACREFIFLSEFFCVQSANAQDLFLQVLGRSLSLLTGNVEQYVQESYDTIALFLCVHLVLRFRGMCHEKDIRALDKYWDTLYSLFWPRLQRVIELNVQSVKECDPQRMKVLDLRPHYVTRRYAELSAAFISVNEACPLSVDGLNNVLFNLQLEIENFILRMAAVFPQRREQIIFIINNYDVILSVMGEKTSGESKESESFRNQFSARTSEYIEEILRPHFGDLIKFVKECEAGMDRGQGGRTSFDLRSQVPKMSKMIAQFNSSWKTALDSLNGEVLNSFPNFKNGTNILQQALTQFVQYYHRFHKILSLPEVSDVAQKNQLINVHQLMVEVKKYKPSF